MEGNTGTWLRKREVATMMHVDLAMVNSYQEQGLLQGKRLFGGRIVIFKRSDVEALIKKLQTQEHTEERQKNGMGK